MAPVLNWLPSVQKCPECNEIFIKHVDHGLRDAVSEDGGGTFEVWVDEWRCVNDHAHLEMASRLYTEDLNRLYGAKASVQELKQAVWPLTKRRGDTHRACARLQQAATQQARTVAEVCARRAQPIGPGKVTCDDRPTIIRFGSRWDIPEILKLGMAMVEESPFMREPFDAEKGGQLLMGLLNPDTPGDVFVVDVGTKETKLAGFMLTTISEFLGTWTPYGAELVFYVAPEHRGRGIARQLIRSLEAWCRNSGVMISVFGDSSGLMPEVAEKLAAELGYVRFGSTFMKRLDPPPGAVPLDRS